MAGRFNQSLNRNDPVLERISDIKLHLWLTKMETRKVEHTHTKKWFRNKKIRAKETLTQDDLQFANGNSGMQPLHANSKPMGQSLDRNRSHSCPVQLDK